MTNRAWWSIILFLFLVIVVLAVILFATPSPQKNPAPTPSASSTEPTSTPPLSARVVVTSPLRNDVVADTFTVAGVAPGPWYFEAQFPIQVRDTQGNIIGQTPGQAQGNWMTDQLVTFTATMKVDATYHGPATLVLLRDNPSGLPQNDDSVSVPIVVR